MALRPAAARSFAPIACPTDSHTDCHGTCSSSPTRAICGNCGNVTMVKSDAPEWMLTACSSTCATALREPASVRTVAPLTYVISWPTGDSTVIYGTLSNALRLIRSLGMTPVLTLDTI